jgi:hypothetical protein
VTIFDKQYKFLISAAALTQAHDKFVETVDEALQTFLASAGIGLTSMCSACETEQPDVSHSRLISDKGHGLCHDCFSEWYDGYTDPAKIKKRVETKRAAEKQPNVSLGE